MEGEDELLSMSSFKDRLLSKYEIELLRYHDDKIHKIEKAREQREKERSYLLNNERTKEQHKLAVAAIGGTAGVDDRDRGLSQSAAALVVVTRPANSSTASQSNKTMHQKGGSTIESSSSSGSSSSANNNSNSISSSNSNKDKLGMKLPDKRDLLKMEGGRSNSAEDDFEVMRQSPRYKKPTSGGGEKYEGSSSNKHPSVPILFEGNWHSKADKASSAGGAGEGSYKNGEILQVPLQLNLSSDGNMDHLLVVHMLVPKDSSCWALNISSMRNNDFNNIYFQCTRAHTKNFLLLNEKPLTWRNEKDKDAFKVIGQTGVPAFGINSSLIHVQGVDLVFRVRNEGIYLFIDSELVGSLPMRRDITRESRLLLSFPTMDDNGNLYGMTIKKVQWAEVGDYDTVYVVPSERIDMYEGVLSNHIDDDPILRTIELSNLFELTDTSSIYDLETHLNNVLETVFEETTIQRWQFVWGKGVAYVRLSDNSEIDKAIRVLNELGPIEGPDDVSKKLVASRVVVR